MTIYLSHSQSFDFKSDLYEPIRASLLDKNHTIFFPHEGGNFRKTKDIIENSDLVIAEVSFSSTGQGIELGWADSLGVPVVCIAKEGSTISGSLKFITENFISYTDSADLISKLETFLSKK